MPSLKKLSMLFTNKKKNYVNTLNESSLLHNFLITLIDVKECFNH